MNCLVHFSRVCPHLTLGVCQTGAPPLKATVGDDGTALAPMPRVLSRLMGPDEEGQPLTVERLAPTGGGRWRLSPKPPNSTGGAIALSARLCPGFAPCPPLGCLARSRLDPLAVSIIFFVFDRLLGPRWSRPRQHDVPSPRPARFSSTCRANTMVRSLCQGAASMKSMVRVFLMSRKQPWECTLSARLTEQA